MESRGTGALLIELQTIWTEIGESEADKERILSDIERECLEVYRRKVDEASKAKAQLHQLVTAKEAEVAALMISLGEHNLLQKGHKLASLREQLSFITPMLENLRVKKEERIKKFIDIRTQIEKITDELAEYESQSVASINYSTAEEHDLSTRKLDEYHAQLHALQKEKSDRIEKILEYVNEVHSLCGVLGIDFRKTVDEVHPSLHEPHPSKSTNISNNTLKGLSQSVMKLRAEKKTRIQKLRETIESLFELWKIMDSSEEDVIHYSRLARILEAPDQCITHNSLLSQETIEQTEAEVARLAKLKAGKMKELVLKRRSELEEICRRAHIEPDTSTSLEKTIALIDSGLVDPSGLLANIESQINKANEEAMSRKEIMERISKWLVARDEENWLEEYNQDSTKYSAGRGAHLNLRRAEKARIIVSKIPDIVDNLISKTFAWEDARDIPFLYDGARLVSVLEEYKLSRQQKEEEKKRYREHKKLQALLVSQKEAIIGSKPSLKKFNSFNKKSNGYQANGKGNGFMTPAPRRVSVGSATPELLTPRSYSGRYTGYFSDARRPLMKQLNLVAVSKEDSMSTFTSISGSEPESPLN